VKLSEYFQQGKPVILQMGYFNCPQLCDKVSEELMAGVKDLNLELGKDYSMLYVSVNPNERWELGQKKKRTYVEEFGKPGAQSGWNFLVTKDQQTIKTLADAVGFNFKKVDGREEFSHPPMITILTADGTISRYLYGFQFPSETLRTGLTEAGQGKVGTYVEQVLVALCYHYDEYSGKYSLSYMRIMQGGAILTMLIVFGILGTKWIKDARAGGSPPPPMNNSQAHA
jgi:protein SCO1/2